jgi:adenosylhomocysteine nucleosidase
MSNANPTATHTLVCFAVAEEARPFQKIVVLNPHPAVRIAVSGMGRCNAQAMIDAELKTSRPGLVLTCGYAGALNPELALGQIVFDADAAFPDASGLEKLGGRAVRFVHSEKIVVTAVDKARLRAETGADAVEMESAIIRAACRDQGIPSATVRVISDTASQDMPLDFNALMTPDLKMSFLRLSAMIMRSPQRIPALWAFGRESRKAAVELGNFLVRFIGGTEKITTRQEGK